MKPIYRQSAISTYLRCGLQYWHRYVEGIIVAPSGAQTVGTSTHKGIASNLVAKKKNGTGLSLEETLQVYSEDFDIRSEVTDWKDDDSGIQKDIGAQCVSVHHKLVAPTIEPEAVEENFVLETDGGYDLTGTLDLIDSQGVIRDAKTSKGPYNQDAIAGALQPAIYDFAYEALRSKKSTGFQYDVLVKPTKTLPARVQFVKSRVTKHDRAWAFETMERVHKGIQAGVFLPAPEDSWVCSIKWCGYWSQCKGRAK